MAAEQPYRRNLRHDDNSWTDPSGQTTMWLPPVAPEPRSHPDPAPPPPPRQPRPEPRAPQRPEATRHLPLPESLFVLGHKEDGKPRFHQRVLNAALAGGLLAELCLANRVRILNGTLHGGRPAAGDREMVARAVTAVGGSPAPVATWLERIAAGIDRAIGAELVQAGLYRPKSARKPNGRLVPADANLVVRTETWLNHSLTAARRLDPTSAALCAIARELDIRPIAWTSLSSAQRAEQSKFIASCCDDSTRVVVGAVHAVTAVTAMGVYR